VWKWVENAIINWNPFFSFVSFLVTLGGFAYTIYGVWAIKEKLLRKKRLPALQKKLKTYSDSLDNYFRDPFNIEQTLIEIERSIFILLNIKKHSTGMLKIKASEAILEIKSLKKRHRTTPIEKSSLWEVKGHIINISFGIEEQIEEDNLDS